MHVPSPSDYRQFDSQAPTVSRDNLDNLLVNLAAATLVLYDHLITFDIEVERIWTLKLGLPKILFFTSRYVMSPFLMIKSIAKIGYPLPFSFCIFGTYLNRPISALSLVVVELVLIVRVSALYGHSMIILSSLACIFTCQLVIVTVQAVSYLKNITTIFYYDCSLSQTNNSGAQRWRYNWWLPFICSDGILLILTLVKVYSYRSHFNHTIRLLARDSVAYFVLMFACLVENVAVTTAFHDGRIIIPTEWIACIAVSRMMMSMRSLAFNEPLGTQRLELSTMVFESRVRTENVHNSR